MGLFKKLANLLEAGLNSALERAESPEKMANLALLELEEKKKRTHELIIQAIARLKLAQKSLTHDQSLASHLNFEQETLQTLKRGVLALNEKIARLKASNAAYSAPQALAQIAQTDAFDTFERMEKKIEDKELAIEALTELLKAEENNRAVSSKPPAQVHTKLDLQALEKELEELKKLT